MLLLILSFWKIPRRLFRNVSVLPVVVWLHDCSQEKNCGDKLTEWLKQQSQEPPAQSLVKLGGAVGKGYTGTSRHVGGWLCGRISGDTHTHAYITIKYSQISLEETYSWDSLRLKILLSFLFLLSRSFYSTMVKSRILGSHRPEFKFQLCHFSSVVLIKFLRCRLSTLKYQFRCYHLFSFWESWHWHSPRNN